jgi:hypothetical protein
MKNLLAACLLASSLTTASMGDAQQPGEVALKALSFLSGRWVSEGKNEVQEETWSPVSGASMTGSFRVVHGGRPQFYEFWAVEIDDGRPTLKMKHFGAHLVGWEEKADSTQMPLISASQDDAIFAERDGSVSLHYHRSADTLTCSVHHVRDGKGSDEIFVLTRAPGY